MCFIKLIYMYSLLSLLFNFPVQNFHGFRLYKKQLSTETLPLQMVILFFQVLKRKYVRIHYLFTKFFQNNIIFTYLYTKSNTFINIMKQGKILLFRSLGMLGFRKKKKKLQSHANYLLGANVIDLFKKLYFKTYLKRVIIKIKGFKRFLKASFSKLHKHFANLRYVFNKKMKAYKKWFNKKNRLVKRLFRKKKTYRMRHSQRRRETMIKRERLSARHQLLRISFISYVTSVPFGGQNFGKKKIFEHYIRKNNY
jgi:ribosomal protein S11